MYLFADSDGVKVVRFITSIDIKIREKSIVETDINKFYDNACYLKLDDSMYIKLSDEIINFIHLINDYRITDLNVAFGDKVK